jgi:hypothetical protein
LTSSVKTFIFRLWNVSAGLFGLGSQGVLMVTTFLRGAVAAAAILAASSAYAGVNLIIAERVRQLEQSRVVMGRMDDQRRQWHRNRRFVGLWAAQHQPRRAKPRAGRQHLGH